MTILKTVVAVVAVLAVVFAIMSLAFPQYIASACESMGMYRMAASYCSYKYYCSGDIGDLDRCARDSIFSGNDKLVVKYCSRLVGDEFDDYCESEEYRQYVYGSLSVSYYRTDEPDEAIDTATGAIDDEFYVGNAFAILATEVATCEDAEVAGAMYDWLNEDERKFSGNTEREDEYLLMVTNVLQECMEVNYG